MYPDRAPYPGLRPFRPDESDIFFGRDDCIDEMLSRLAATRFLAVLGSSGIGKSSLVKTGLLSALQMGLLRGAGSSWLVVDFRPVQPEGSPLRNLARGLLQTVNAPATTEAVADLRAYLMQRGPRALLNWCRDGNLPKKTNLLLLVDQFEELFRYQDYGSREEAEAFVALLLESAKPLEAVSPEMAEFPIYVILTMRSEFLGACSLIQNLPEAITRGAYLTPRMTRDQYSEAIMGPAAVCGIGIDERLVNRLLNDLTAFAPWDEEAAQPQSSSVQVDRLDAHDLGMQQARRADQLPVLQHALNQMWRKACERTRAEAGDAGATREIDLTMEDYTAVGGLENALNAHADAVLDHVSQTVGGSIERTAERLFRALVTGPTPSDAVRRPTRFEDLIEIAADDRGVRAIVEAFRADECNFLMPEPTVPLAPGTMLDISHESLIRQWKRLSQWVVVETAAAQQWRRLNDRFNMGEPLHGRALENFVIWREETLPNAAWAKRYGGADYDAVNVFLGRNERAEKYLKWLRNAGVVGLVVFFAAVASVMTYFYQSVKAERNRAQAAEQKAINASVDSGEVATFARQQLSDIAGSFSDAEGDTLDWAPPAWSAYLHRRKADALIMSGNFSTALRQIDLAKEANPNYLPALVTSSDLYDVTGNADAADRDARLYLQSKKTDADAYANLVLADAMLGNYDEAASQVDEALSNARLPVDGTESLVAPDVQAFTGGFRLSEPDSDFLVALRYTKAFLYAMKGDERFRTALESADNSDRDYPYSRNAYLAAINWQWLIVRGRASHDAQKAQANGGDAQALDLADYGAYAIEGALWDRVAMTRPDYHQQALSAYGKFQAAYRSHPQERYKSLAAWVEGQMGSPPKIYEEPTIACPNGGALPLVDCARALAQQAEELKAPAGNDPLNFVPAFAQLSQAIDLLTPKAGAVPGRRQQDLLIDLLLRRADWRLSGGADEKDKGGATDDARAVISLDANVPDAYRVLAAAAYDDATRKTNDEQALKLDPYNSEALNDLAKLIQKDNPKRALTLLQQRQRVATTWSDDYSLLAQLQSSDQVRNYAEALRDIDTAIADAPWQLDFYTQRRNIEAKMSGAKPATVILDFAQQLRDAAEYEVRTGDDGLALKRYLLAFTTLSREQPLDADAKFELQTIVRNLSAFLSTNYNNADAVLFWQSLSHDPQLNSAQQQVAAQEAARLSH